MDKESKIIIGGFLGLLILITGGMLWLSKTSASPSVEATSNANAVTKVVSHEWGEIGINDGNALAEFSISNDGTDTLKLFNVVTSCACTTAQIVVGDEVSPLFGMHTKSNYIAEVPAGDTAILKVEFDPAFHGPGGVGPVNRQIVVETNDPGQPELNFMATGTVRK